MIKIIKRDFLIYIIGIIISLIMSISSISYLLIYDKEIIVEYRDLMRFPSTSLYQDATLFTWSELGSLSNIQDIARSYLYYPSYLLSIENLSRFYLLIFYFMVTFIPYISFFYLYRNFLGLNIRYAFLLSTVLSFFYSTNPYIIQNYSPPNAYMLAYSLLPAIVVSTIYFSKIGDIKTTLLLALLITITITPIIRYVVHISILILVTTSIFAWFYYKTISLKDFTKKYIFLIILLLLFNLYWMMPTINSFGYTTMVPTYSMNYDISSTFSQAYAIKDIFTLNASWWPTLRLKSLFLENGILFIIPVLSLISILFWKNYSKEEKVLLSIGVVIYITGILLWNGLKWPTTNIYDILLFNSPPFIGWMFRSSGYFGALVVLGYSLCIGVIFSNILKIKKKKLNYIGTGLLLVLLILIAITGWQKFTGDLDGILENGYYSKDREFYDKIPYNKSIVILSKYNGNFQSHHTGKPYINLNNGLNKYLTNLLEKNDDKSLAFIMSNIGVDALVTNKNINNTALFTLYSEPIQGINVYVLKKKGTYIHNISTFTYVPNYRYDYIGSLSQLINTNITMIGRNDDNYKNIIDPINIDLLSDQLQYIEPYKMTNRYDPNKLWSKAMTNDPLHGEWHPYIEKRGIKNWDSDYRKGIVFTRSNSIIDSTTNPSKKELSYQYNFEKNSEEWNINNKDIQTLKLDNYAYSGKKSIQSILNKSRWGWSTINSPLILANYQKPYRFVFYVKGESVQSVHAKIVEFDSNKDMINVKTVSTIGTGTFDWKEVSFDYMPINKNVSYIRLQIWHGHETTQPLPNKIWIDDVKIYNLSKYIKPVTIDMDLKVDKDDEYELFVRYFKNKDGGRINVSIDGKIKNINTKDQLNKFVWKKVDTLNLKKGKYKLTLTNDEGFNAVNIFALIPKKEYEEMEKNVTSLIEGKRLIYIFEAESDLYRDNASISEKYGGKASNGEVLEFNEPSLAWQTIDILRSDNYKMALKINGSFGVKVDDMIYNVSSNMSDFVYIGPMYLNKGSRKVEVQGSNSDLDVIWLYSVNNVSKKIESNIIPDTTIPVVWSTGREIAIKTDKYRGFIPINQSSGNVIEINEGDNVTWFNEETIPVTFFSDIPGFGIKFLDYGKRISYMFTRQGTYHFYFKENKNFNVTIVVRSLYDTLDNDTNVDSFIDNSEKLEDIFTVKEIPATIIDYTKINPTLYNTKINATKPFMLSFAESYDPLWTVKIDRINGKPVKSEIIRPIPLYSVVNGFWIDQTGDLDITIEYEPQRWFYIGAAISITTLIICIGYLIYDWRKKKNDKK